ncbi:GNAT family N-acetyltransferase [Psychromonas sp. MB-3u-54]|uniref:GNAT family N-acetyltransferase n=1 Tax=Psychromonas sp. MB-3u-54 TaxID=2058319 RepID=UPI000C33DE91|nr:GNAT family N-acetyltransferase [Psychromonas sp. MB-3u-54]PKH03156.1 GNAT family N-acetyltransferase [Psychromonas sp. MB-3u-54]
MPKIHTQDPKFFLQTATPDDAALVVNFMKKLGDFQQMADKIIATPERIERLLAAKQGEAVFGVYDGKMVGFAYFHQKSSAFTGRSGLYIDGFFIDDSMRGKGLGNIMMHFLSKYALERGCEMLEWACLDWNTPAIEFYQKLGSDCIDTMRIYRLSPENLAANAQLFKGAPKVS